MRRPLFWTGISFLSITAVVCLFSDLLAVFLVFSTLFSLLFLSQAKSRRQILAILTAAALGALFTLIFLRLEDAKYAPIINGTTPLSFEVEIENAENDGVYHRLQGSGLVFTPTGATATPITVSVYGQTDFAAGEIACGKAHRPRLYNGSLYLTAKGGISVKEKPSPRLAVRFKLWQQALSLRVRSLCRDKTAADMLSAVLCGDKSGLKNGINDAFRKSGISHLLVISGMHLVMVSTAFEALIGFIQSKRLKTLLSLLFCWGFALLSGFGASVIRAAIMLSLMKTGELFDRRSDTLTSLCTAALIMTLCEPRIVTTASFLLSFSAVLGIASLQKPVSNAASALFKPKGRLLPHLLEAFSCALAAQVSTLPVLVFLFGFFPLWGVFANIFTVLLLSPMMLLGFAALALSFVSPLAAGVLMNLACLLSKAMLFLARAFSALPLSQLSLASLWQGVLIIALLFMLAYCVTRGIRGKAASLFFLCAASITLSFTMLSAVTGLNQTNVVLFNEGESAIIAKGSHAVVLGVPKNERESESLQKVLLRLGVLNVDMLLCEDFELTAQAAGILKQYPDCRLVSAPSRMSGVFAHALGKTVYALPQSGVLLGGKYERSKNTICISFSHGSLLKSGQNYVIIGKYRPMPFLDEALKGYIL